MIRLATWLRCGAPALACALAACGDGSGSGTASTPPPPATYTKIADMSGNQTFQTAGVTYTFGAGGASNGTAQTLGNGVTVAYNAATDVYTVTAPGGSPSQTFGPNDVQPLPQTPTSLRYVKTTGTTVDTLILTPSTLLSYALFGSWSQLNTTNNTSTFRLAIGGSPTLASDMPKTGSATYNTAFGGTANANGATYNLAGNTSGTLSANFGAGTVSSTLNMGGTQVANGPVTQLGAFTGSGTIASGGPGFSGTLTGTPGSGVFAGAFFGPQALEAAYSFFVSGTNFNAVGQGGGVKQ
jgi:hypothetical protein